MINTFNFSHSVVDFFSFFLSFFFFFLQLQNGGVFLLVCLSLCLSVYFCWTFETFQVDKPGDFTDIQYKVLVAMVKIFQYNLKNVCPYKNVALQFFDFLYSTFVLRRRQGVCGKGFNLFKVVIIVRGIPRESFPGCSVVKNLPALRKTQV